MFSFLDPLRDITFVSVMLRMLLALLLGGLIGLERSYKNRPAGLRTHILICIGATVASMTGVYLYLNIHLPTDISRIGAQVVSGLGFIGAGTIIVTKRKSIKGLTTAAGLWASGIIGLAIGSGYFEGALLATLAVLFTQVIVSWMEAKIKHCADFRISVTYQVKTSLDHVLRFCKDRKCIIRNLQVIGDRARPTPIYEAIVTLRPRKMINRADLIARIREMDGVIALKELED